MRLSLSIGLLACSFGSVLGGPADDAVKKDLDWLQGTWAVQSSNTEGRETPKEELEVMRLIIKGDRWNYSIGGGKPVFDPAPKVVLDPSTKPMTLDVLSESMKGKTVLCAIYKFDGDTLTVCYAVGKGNTDRPKEFKSEPGSKTGITVYKRVK